MKFKKKTEVIKNKEVKKEPEKKEERVGEEKEVQETKQEISIEGLKFSPESIKRRYGVCISRGCAAPVYKEGVCRVCAIVLKK